METYKIITARYDSHARAVEMTDRHREEERERENGRVRGKEDNAGRVKR